MILYVKRLLIIFAICATPVVNVWAIDNPDAPDFVADFHSREHSYLVAIENASDSAKEISEVHHRYLTFLDGELNASYRDIMAKLKQNQQEQLKSSQREWIKFRDGELEFINGNWTPENFGSSSALSRYEFQEQIVRDRIVQLLQYRKNYGA